jgi:hypothetical protein
MRSALADFQSEISRIDKVADWLITPDALESKMMPATVAIRCGAVVLLSGYFETFLKDCMCKFITQVNGLGKPLSTLPGKMKITHFENGARALSKEIRKAKKINDTSLCEDLAARLASVSASTGYTLAWEAFADTDANPGPSIVGGLLSSVGIEDPWRKIKAVPPGGLGDLDLVLTSFIEMRNECAHSGNTTSPPTASDLTQYGQNFAGLGTAIVVVLETRLSELAAL